MKTYQIFLVCLISRILFKVLSGYDNFELFPDSYRYDNLSDKILAGEGNMDIIAYLCAPLYPYLLSLIKLITVNHWETIAISIQFVLVSLSAVYIYKIALLLFQSVQKASIAALLYIFYPLTLWYNFTIGQETLFQSLFIISLFYFFRSLKEKSFVDTVIGSVIFSLALLTKSHITIFIPLLAMTYAIYKQWSSILVLLTTVLLSSLPHGLKNLQQHGIYTLSSQGNASLFILGHNDQTYPCLMSRAGDMGEFSAQGCDPSFVFDTSYVYPIYGKVNLLSAKERNKLRMKMALSWIKENPSKFIKLKLFGLQRFILPGLDHKQYKTSYWLLSFIAGLLIYLPGYYNLAKLVSFRRANPHLILCSLILVSAAIFLVFFPINRFRVITMEPMLCVYAAPFYASLISRLSRSLIPLREK